MESEEANLLKQSQKNRFLFQEKVIEASSNNYPSGSAIVSDYEPSSGLMHLSNPDGSNFYARAITNGAIALRESVRVRNGIIPSFDAMPRTRPSTPTKVIQVKPAIIIGFLIPVVNGGTGDRLGQVAYTFNFYYSYLAFGYLQNNILQIKAAFQGSRPSNVFQIYDSISPIPIFGYYSMGLTNEKIIHFTYESNTSLPNRLSDSLSMKITMREYGLNIKNLNNISTTGRVINLSASGITINNTNYNSNTNPIPTEFPFGEIIKYRNSDGIIKYVAVSACASESGQGGHRSSGVVIWDLGDIDSIPSVVTNPACHFGFSWTYAAQGVSGIIDPVLCFGGYGTDGGIILKISTIEAAPLAPPMTAVGYAFIPEKYLVGSNGVEISRENILIVTVPPPSLDSRSTVYEKAFNIDPGLSLTQGNYKLFFYSNFKTDTGKQVFS